MKNVTSINVGFMIKISNECFVGAAIIQKSEKNGLASEMRRKWER